MWVERATYKQEGDKGELALRTTSPDARRLPYEFVAGEYELKRVRPKRSLDANAYCWTLIDKIASAVRLLPAEVYRNAIREIAGVSDIVCIKVEALNTFKDRWESRGIGWQIETMPSKIKGCINCKCFYGSSVYDSGQMSQIGRAHV